MSKQRKIRNQQILLSLLVAIKLSLLSSYQISSISHLVEGFYKVYTGGMKILVFLALLSKTLSTPTQEPVIAALQVPNKFPPEFVFFVPSENGGRGLPREALQIFSKRMQIKS